MAQADTIAVDNSTGQLVRTGINANIEAALTNSSGATPPPVAVPGLWWWHPDGQLAIRNQENANWQDFIGWGHPDDPGAQNNEAAGYPAGAIWGTTAGRLWKHSGSGTWVEWGSGTGGGGTSDGFGMVDFGNRFERSADEPLTPVMIDLGSRFVREE